MLPTSEAAISRAAAKDLIAGPTRAQACEARRTGARGRTGVVGTNGRYITLIRFGRIAASRGGQPGGAAGRRTGFLAGRGDTNSRLFCFAYAEEHHPRAAVCEPGCCCCCCPLPSAPPSPCSPDADAAQAGQRRQETYAPLHQRRARQQVGAGSLASKPPSGSSLRCAAAATGSELASYRVASHDGFSPLTRF
jgi:hypothetical protein